MALVWMAVLAVAVAVALWYSKWRHGYWAAMGVPSPPALPFLGHMHKLMYAYTWEEVDQMYRRFSSHSFFGLYSFFQPGLMIRDPEIIKNITIKDFDHFVDRRTFTLDSESVLVEMLTNKTGDEWKALRSVMSTAFSSGKMKRMFPLVNEIADVLVASCLKDAKQNPILNMKDKFGRFTMDSIASCAFGIQCNSLTEEKPVFAENANKFFEIRPTTVVRLILLLNFPRVFKALGFKLDSPEVIFFRDVVEETIRSRESGQQRGDFLDLMLEERRAGSEDPTISRLVLQDRTVVAQSILFLVAGYENTASVLAFASHLLAKNPEQLRRLRQEVRDLVKEGGELTYQGVMEAKLLNACIMETLRLYPPGFIIERLCTKPYRLAGTNVTLRVGDLVQYPVWSVHRDPQYWPQPLEFQPDRFLPENKANIRSCTHMPFGVGPRNCIAMRFALMVIKIALAKLVLAVDFQVVPGHEEITLGKSLFRPKDGVPILIKPLTQE